MIKYYPDNSSTPTFPEANSRLVLAAMGGGTSSNTNGVIILLERYNSNEYITV